MSKELENDVLFNITKKYTVRLYPYDTLSDIDKRFVQLDIETIKPLPHDFYTELMDLVSKHCRQ